MKRLLAVLALASLFTETTAHAQTKSSGLSPLPPSLPLKHTPKPTKPAIVSEDLMTRLYIFADDSMEGRQDGTAGNVKGTTYLAAEAKRIGLQPGGDNGTYFQVVSTYAPVLRANSTMLVEGKPLTLWKDFAPLPMTRAVTARVEVIYAGRAGETSSLTPEQTQGKFVIFGPRTKADPAGVIRSRQDNAFAIGYVNWDHMGGGVRQVIQFPLPKPSETPLTDSATKQGFVYLSHAAAEQIFGKPIEQLEPGSIGKAISLDYTWAMGPAPFASRNVVGIIPGSDPTLSQTYIALGAHNDHVGMGRGFAGLEYSPAIDHDSLRVYNHFARLKGATGQRSLSESKWAEVNAEIARLRKVHPPRLDSIFNGADDDGSGSVALLEIAEYLLSLKVKPKRSIMFVWHSGEERGGRGATWFTKFGPIPRDSIVAQLNADMIGRGGASDRIGGGPDFLQIEGSRCMSKELGDIVDSVNVQKKHNLKFHYSNQHFTASDQIVYARAGIPAVFFFTDLHPDYHQETDEPQYIDYDHMRRITSLISDVALHLGNLKTRPLEDNPDGWKTCR